MMKNPSNNNRETKLVSQKQLNRRNFISFSVFGGVSALLYGGWRWLYRSPEEIAGTTGGAHKLLRRALNQNELVFKNTLSNNHLVQTYPKSMAAKSVRVNSKIGMEDDDFDGSKWSLQVNRRNGTSLKLNLEDLKALPKTEIVFDFKCVEGWDQISHWGGVKFSDFIDYYHLQEEANLQYVGLATPDEGYYVGLDMPSALHPQTLLAYEVNDEPLPLDHGFPLRLIIPVKYGIKNLKRIGSISFNDQRPPDYWAEQGYDYFSGL